MLFTQIGWTPLMAASFYGHGDVVKMLIETKADIDTQDAVRTLFIPLENMQHIIAQSFVAVAALVT